MNKEEAKAKIEQGDGDFHVYTQDEHKAFLDNLKESDIFQKSINTRMGEFLGEIDDTLYGITGKKRDQGIKTSDFVRQEFDDMATRLNELESRNTELKKAIDDKAGNDETLKLLKSENDALLKKHQTKMDEWKSKYENLESQGQKMRILNEFDQSLTGLKFKSIIPEDTRQTVIEAVKSDLSKSATYVDGKLVFMDADGNVMRDETTMIPLTAKDLMAAKLKSIIDEGQKQTGVDIGDEGDPDKGISIPDTVKTNVDLGEHLLKLGYKRNSDEYMKLYAKYRDKLKVIT